MSYRIQIELGEKVATKEKVLLHAKFLRHFQRRRLNKDARGRTNWTMEFASEKSRFTIIWGRQPRVAGRACRFNQERLMGWVVIKFSQKEIEGAGVSLVMGDWSEIERAQRNRERVAR
jgi:hypothetical protein